MSGFLKIKEMKMETVIVQIRAAEGGDDAKDLVNTMLGIYTKACARYCL